MAKPHTLWRVEIVASPAGGLRYAQRGGGTFSSAKHARLRKADLEKQGFTCKLFTCKPDWKEVRDDITGIG